MEISVARAGISRAQDRDPSGFRRCCIVLFSTFQHSTLIQIFNVLPVEVAAGPLAFFSFSFQTSSGHRQPYNWHTNQHTSGRVRAYFPIKISRAASLNVSCKQKKEKTNIDSCELWGSQSLFSHITSRAAPPLQIDFFAPLEGDGMIPVVTKPS